VVGVDVGGTFTDLAVAGANGLVERVLKVPSTPDDPSRGVLDALDAAGIPLEGLSGLLHGTTIATNAIIERTGSSCALITTRGFRDVLELGRRDRIQLYGLTGVQEPLITRDNRWEIDERIDYQGNELVGVDVDAVARLADELVSTGVEVVIVALLHSYANPAHERQVAEVLHRTNPSWHVVTSSSVVTEYYEFERTSSAVVHGYLQPLVTRYAEALSTKLAERGFIRDALVMQSNGGVVPLRRLGSRSSHIIRSGPAAGVMAASKIARGAGFDRVITGDMGGTSFDVAVVIDGEPSISETTLLDFRVPLRVPMIDVHTIGAGGGSIVSVDRGGTLQVGPRSAGAVPGPVCFRRGGTEATVTDANVVLGRINADQPIGGDQGPALDVEAARAALGRIGERLGLGVEQTAQAVLAVVNVRMAGRMRLLSVERGYDPREFALVAFGGAGPLHAAALLREVGVRTLLVPANPGVLCAEGCIAADLRYDFSQTLERRVDSLEPGELDDLLLAQAEQGTDQLHTDDEEVDRIDVVHQADMAYLGQVHRLRVTIERGWNSDRAARAFIEAYERDYGTQLTGVPILLVNARTSVRGVRQTALATPPVPTDVEAPDPKERRQVYFDDAWHDTPTYDRRMLTPGMRLVGPAVVEQADTTTVVEPGMSVWVDAQSNLQIEVRS
jgi:N-methylhydantoinase A